jgi:hypothetical protein
MSRSSGSNSGGVAYCMTPYRAEESRREIRPELWTYGRNGFKRISPERYEGGNYRVTVLARSQLRRSTGVRSSWGLSRFTKNPARLRHCVSAQVEGIIRYWNSILLLLVPTRTNQLSNINHASGQVGSACLRTELRQNLTETSRATHSEINNQPLTPRKGNDTNTRTHEHHTQDLRLLR